MESQKHSEEVPELAEKLSRRTVSTPAPVLEVQPDTGISRGRGFLAKKVEASELPRDVAQPKGRVMGRGRARGGIPPGEL